MTKPRLDQGADYERGFVDGMQHQMQSNVDKAVNRMAQPQQEPLGKLQEPTAERAWFTIAELNAWADKKLSENPHWVMPKDEPEREWVGLTDEEITELHHEIKVRLMGTFDTKDIYRAVEQALKEKNT